MGQQDTDLTFRVPGDPRGKGRPRTRVIPASPPYAHIYSDHSDVKYEERVRESYELEFGNLEQIEDGVAVEVNVTAHFRMPKSLTARKKDLLHDAPCLKKPDGDNVLKIITDALSGVAYHDDKQVFRMTIDKFWTAGDPFVEVTVKQEKTDE